MTAPRLTVAEADRARRWLLRQDQRLAPLIRRVGRCRLPDSGSMDPFASLVRAILSQQLSAKAARTIHGRLAALVGGETHLTPRAVLTLNVAAVRAAGVSRPKVSYLRDLSTRVVDGSLDLHAFDTHDDEAVIEAITEVNGLGRWSAEMFLMFRLNRPDVFPIGDLGIVKGMQHVLGMKRRPAPRTMLRAAELWRPYRSVAAWYLWRLAD